VCVQLNKWRKEARVEVIEIAAETRRETWTVWPLTDFSQSVHTR